jgi:ABC-type Fe3+ transport system permease subunit
MIQNSCAVVVLGLVTIALVVGGAVFLVNWPEIEREQSSQEWARAAQKEAQARIVEARSNTMLAAIAGMVLVTIFGFSLAFVVVMRDIRNQPPVIVRYIDNDVGAEYRIARGSSTQLAIPDRSVQEVRYGR